MSEALSRRSFLKRSAGAAVAAGLSGPFMIQGCARRARLNIVVLLLDALRADRLGCYGYKKPTSPNIDRVASAGALMTRNYAQGPDTWISMPSIFSSLYPLASRADGCLKLAEEVETFPEALADAGYATFLYNSNPVIGPERGTTQGFQNVVEFDRSAEFSEEMRGLLRRASQTRPFFLFAHVTIPHMPYDPPEEYLNKFVTDRPQRMAVLMSMNSGSKLVDPKDANGWKAVYFKEAGLSEDEAACLKQLYDANVARADYYVGVADAELENLGIRDETLFVIMSDHGEELLENGQIDHGRWLNERLLHTPLVLRLAGRVPQTRVEQITENIDVGATLLDYAGVTRRFGQGRSIRPLIEGGASAGRRFTFGVSSLEQLYTQVPDLVTLYTRSPALSHLVTRDAIAYGRLGMDEFIWPTSCVSDGARRLTKTLTGEEKTSLFSLKQDPLELRDLLEGAQGTGGSLVAELENRLDEWQRECEQVGSKYPLIAAPDPYLMQGEEGWFESLTPEQQERMKRLKALGYI